MSPIQVLAQAMVALRYPELCRRELREVGATPGRYPLWGRQMPGAPGSTPGRPGCKEGDGRCLAQRSPQRRTTVLSSIYVHTAPFLATCSHAPPFHAPGPSHALYPPWAAPALSSHSPHAPGHWSHRLLGHKDVAGKAA